MRKLIALAAGGTGGHMFPAQALAEEMRRRGWDLLLFTDERGMRYGENIRPEHQVMLKASNPAASGPAAKVQAGVALLGGILQARKAISDYRPSMVVGFGGYPSAPAMIAARMKKTPYGVHEQNAVLGRVNRLVAKDADFVAHAFPRLDRLPEGCRGEVVETGNPVRDVIREVAGAAFVPPAGFSEISLFIFGGSQGARIISQNVPTAVCQLGDDLKKRLKVVQQAREEDVDAVRSAYQEAGIAAEVAPFFGDMPERLKRAHLVVCRAGASSVTELALVGRPSILIPLAIAMDDHQTGNASVLKDREAAIIVPETALTPDHMSSLLHDLLTSPARLAQMAENARQVAPEGAVAKVAEMVERFAA